MICPNLSRFFWRSWFGLIIAVSLPGCTGEPNHSGNSQENRPIGSEEELRITGFCAKCHESPNPEYFPKGLWTDEVYRGYRFYVESSMNGDTTPPDAKRTIKYFVDRAPKVLPKSDPIRFVEDDVARFRLSGTQLPSTATSHAIAHLSWKRWEHGGLERMVMADMHAGVVSFWDAQAGEHRQMASIPHPAHVDWCDLDGDGFLDLIVGDLGSDQPQDHSLGGVHWIRQHPAGRLESSVIVTGLGRVAEARTADFTGDGQLDIIIAEFGSQATGSITLLEREGSKGGAPKFRKHRIDGRHGAMRVIPLDIDRDGDMDFVTLIAQEFETVEAFLNRGDGTFESRPLCPPRDPSFGSSGLEAADLDGDGDVDFLVSNGDMFDSFVIKPYHQLRWLENLGDLKFAEHHLVTLPGCHGAAVGDIDLDGDLDLMTTVCFPLRTIRQFDESGRNELPSAVWLEQSTPGVFVPHRLEFASPFHACQTLADVDGDGDLDAVLGMYGTDKGNPTPPYVIFENTTREPKSPGESNVTPQ